MTDSQILQESFLEDLNNVLNTGEIPNLMLAEDKDKVQNEIRTAV
jgi:dynein heavy chain